MKTLTIAAPIHHVLLARYWIAQWKIILPLLPEDTYEGIAELFYLSEVSDYNYKRIL